MGSLVGGILFQSVGGGHTFEIFGIAAFIAFVVHVCLQMFLQRSAVVGSGSQNGKNTSNANLENTADMPLDNSNSKTKLTSNAVVNNSEVDGFTDIDLSKG